MKEHAMKKRKKTKGFTLVEVIVVAVIVAVLAAVAIPLYNGYIRDSRDNVCQNTAATIASAFTAAVQQNGSFNGPSYSGQQSISIPAATAGNPPNNITIPTGYTSTITATNVTVAGPGSSTSTAVQYK